MSFALPLIPTILGAVVSNVLAPKAPSSHMPAAPTPAAPPAPPTVSTAEKAQPEGILDTEAAQLRAQKRRRAEAENQLFTLADENTDAVTLAKSLLGD